MQVVHVPVDPPVDPLPVGRVAARWDNQVLFPIPDNPRPAIEPLPNYPSDEDIPPLLERVRNRMRMQYQPPVPQPRTPQPAVPPQGAVGGYQPQPSKIPRLSTPPAQGNAPPILYDHAGNRFLRELVNPRDPNRIRTDTSVNVTNSPHDFGHLVHSRPPRASRIPIVQQPVVRDPDDPNPPPTTTHHWSTRLQRVTNPPDRLGNPRAHSVQLPKRF